MPKVSEKKLEELSNKYIKAERSPLTREDNYDEWVAARWSKVGSSTVAKLLGLSKYTSPRKVWEEYKNQESSFKENPFSRAGLHTEDFIMVEAEIQNPQYEIYPLNWTYYNDNYPIASATPDGLVKKKGRKDWGLNETKFTSAKADLDTWYSGGVPAWVYAQLQWQLGVCGLKWGIVTAMVQGNPLMKIIEVEFNPTVFEAMYATATQFMESLDEETPPKLTGKDVDKELANTLLLESGTYNPEEEVNLDLELETDLTSLLVINQKLKDAQAVVKDLKSQKTQLENNFKDVSQGAGVLKDTLGRKVIISKVERGEYVNKASTYFTVKVREAEGE